MTLRVLQEAEWEARDAACWYDDQREGLGTEFLDEYAAALLRIEQRPDSFAHLETVHTSKQIRRCLLRRFPYIVVFEVLADECLVLAVAHVRRRPNYWIERRR